jgi:hypothetical protein
VKVEDVNGTSQRSNGTWQGNGHHPHPPQPMVQSWSSLPPHRAAHENNNHAIPYHMDEDTASTNHRPEKRHESARNGHASHREVEVLSDSEDDEEFIRSHSTHLVKYMIDVHKRRKKVLEDYERKREVCSGNTFDVRASERTGGPVNIS